MPGVFPNGAEAVLIDYITNNDVPEDLVLCLYKNDITPGETDTIVTYTESDFTGYSNITLTPASWTGGAYPLQTFTSSAGQTLQNQYGYFIKRTTTGDLIFAERFSDGPYAIENNGDDVDVTVNLAAE